MLNPFSFQFALHSHFEKSLVQEPEMFLKEGCRCHLPGYVPRCQAPSADEFCHISWCDIITKTILAQIGLVAHLFLDSRHIMVAKTTPLQEWLLMDRRHIMVTNLPVSCFLKSAK